MSCLSRELSEKCINCVTASLLSLSGSTALAADRRREDKGVDRMKLTPRQQRFVEEYLVDFNGKQAAIRAGYAPHTADVTGSQLLALPKVKARVDWAIANRVNRIQVRQDDVVRELLRLANVNVAHAFAPDGKLLPIHEIPEDVQRAISTLEFE